MIFMLGCKAEFDDSDYLPIGDTIVDTAPDPDTFVCDPFEPESEDITDVDNYGVLAHLYYLTDEMPRVSSVKDLINNGVAIENLDLYFNQINVPTRPFDRGFVTQGGVTIMNEQGNTLYEYFALDFNGRLQLSEGMTEGKYQLMALADDGAILTVDRNGELKTLINNDGNHPTKMGCATEPLDMSYGKPVTFNLKYHQGPRYHIALMLMWRPWPENEGDVNDVLCGQQGNNKFFDYTQDPPTPQPAYNDLLSRGWKILGPENFLLPSSSIENPCNTPAPIISDFEVEAKTSDSITITWKTDLPSTSQLQYKHAVTEEEKLTDQNLELKTEHRVVISGLDSFTVYYINAISKSVSARETVSSQYSVRTEWAP